MPKPPRLLLPLLLALPLLVLPPAATAGRRTRGPPPDLASLMDGCRGMHASDRRSLFACGDVSGTLVEVEGTPDQALATLTNDLPDLPVTLTPEVTTRTWRVDGVDLPGAEVGLVSSGGVRVMVVLGVARDLEVGLTRLARCQAPAGQPLQVERCEALLPALVREGRLPDAVAARGLPSSNQAADTPPAPPRIGDRTLSLPEDCRSTWDEHRIDVACPAWDFYWMRPASNRATADAILDEALQATLASRPIDTAVEAVDCRLLGRPAACRRVTSPSSPGTLLLAATLGKEGSHLVLCNWVSAEMPDLCKEVLSWKP